MKFKKTPGKERGTYKLFDDNGNFVTEYKPGKDGVTEIDIINLHKIDDSEVHINCKEMKLPEWYQSVYDEWKNKFIAEFKEKYGRKPYNNEIPGRHRVLESVDFTVDDEELGDKSCLQEKLSVSIEEDEPSLAVLRLREIISRLPEKKRSVYELVIIGRLSNKDAGEKLNISGQRVGQIVNEIITAVESDKI